MTQNYWVMDASAFFANIEPTIIENTEFVTTSHVFNEIKDNTQVSWYLEILQIRGNFSIEDPLPESIERVIIRAKQTGDFSVLSRADLSILALALEKTEGYQTSPVFLVSDDYAVQNVGTRLGLQIKALKRTMIQETIDWQIYCPNCRSIFKNVRVGDECIDCGGTLRRRRKYRKRN